MMPKSTLSGQEMLDELDMTTRLTQPWWDWILQPTRYTTVQAKSAVGMMICGGRYSGLVEELVSDPAISIGQNG